MNSILFSISEQIKNITILMYPIIPISSKKVLDTINFPEQFSIKEILNDNTINHDKELQNLDILFKKIEDDN